jgi:hypothetical protein
MAGTERDSLSRGTEAEQEAAKARHQAVYTTPGLPRFVYHRACASERLWHGRNPLTAVDVELLLSLGVTHVLDLRERWEWAAPGRFGGEAVAAFADAAAGIERLHLPVEDGGTPDGEGFARAVAFLDGAYTVPSGRAYVHCRLGRERTGAVLAAWRALRDGTTAAAALTALNAEGARLDPLPHQLRAAQEFVDSARGPRQHPTCRAPTD